MTEGPPTKHWPPQVGIFRPGNVLSIAVLLLAAAIATAPLRFYNFSCGHDFDFHLASWLDALHSWHQGILYPHWTPSPNYGAGEPRFLFYPPLTWMLGAALGGLISWMRVPIVLTFLLLAATGFGTRALARRMMGIAPATLAGCFAIFSAYALFTVYERSAYAELTGGFWIPLLLLFALRDILPRPRSYRPERSGIASPSPAVEGSAVAAIPIAIVLAGAWLSNAPLGVMASYLLAAVTLAVAVLTRSWRPILHASVGAILGLGLASVYLVPAAYEQRWVDIRQATDDPGLLIQNSFLFGRHGFNPQLEQHDIELLKVSIIAVLMLTITVGGLLICLVRRRLSGARARSAAWWIPLALIPLAILFLQLPLSLPIWEALPKLRFLQFPWRWLVVLEAPMAIFAAQAVWTFTGWRRHVLLVLCGLAFLGSTAFAGFSWFQSCDAEDAIPSMVNAFRSGAGFEGTDEYGPPNADNALVATGLPAACLVADPTVPLGAGDPDLTPEWAPEQGTCKATFAFQAVAGQNPIQHKRVQVTAPQAGFLVLRLREYPAWAVHLNGAAVAHRPERQDGLIVLPVPAGASEVAVDWTTTRDVVIGRWISLIALVLVTIGGLISFRKALIKLK